MAFILHLLTASKDLDELATYITNILPKSETLIANYLDTNQFDIDVIVRASDWVISELGIGGYAPRQHEIQLSLAPDNEYLLTHFDQVFTSTLAHETHHCFRHASVGYGNTLFEAMLTEGLACHFEVEVGFTKPIYVDHLDQHQRQALLKRAKASWHDHPYHHNHWFFGSEDMNIPKWAGYDLGYYLTRLYLHSTGQTASNSVNTSAGEILKVLSSVI